MSGVTVTARGPLFDGRAEHALKKYEDDLERDYSHEGVLMVQRNLDRVLKHPTGYYRSHIQNAAAGDGQSVTDGNVIYGPWLEGVGSRNATTRFKGYGTFRKTSQEMNAKAGAFANRMLPRYVAQMQ